MNQTVREIIVDSFAGGGGASTGIKMATGRSPDIAINHDQEAISMHTANHPETKHYCEDIWQVDPREATNGRPVGMAWFSPDCTHFSLARGGKPVEKSIRGLAWVTLRWAATVRPRVVFLENVKEFQTWGPLLKNGLPDPKRKGLTFKTFVNALRRQGYQVDYRVLKASDYGAPTRRERFFLIARCDGRPIVWPQPTHGDPENEGAKTGRLKAWRTAAEIIDWSLPCPSIFERKKPLAENTLRRIALGIKKFLMESSKPFIAPVDIKGVRDHSQMVIAFLSQYYTETCQGEVRGQSLRDPIYTIPTANRFALVTSHIVKLRGTNLGHRADEPLHTITARGTHLGEVRAFLIAYYGSSIGQDLDEPLQTIVSKDRFGLVMVYGQAYQIVDVGMRMLQPHELYAGQGFPSDYIFDHDATGRKFTKKTQVDKCGNSVPPDFSDALVWANLPELCVRESTSEVING